MTWVYLTIFAAFMQAIRYAGQKHLGATVHIFLASWARFSFGLPWAVLATLVFMPKIDWQALYDWRYFAYILLISLSQLAATILSVMLLGRRNFAVGSTLVKTEAIFVALLGWVFFAEALSMAVVIALIIGTVGIFLISMEKFDLSLFKILAKIDSVSAWLGLGAGALFAVASISIRHANHLFLDIHAPLLQALITLTLVLTIQTIVGLIFLILYRPFIFSQVIPNLRLCVFTGATGVFGSFGWFSAFTLINATYVKTLGHIEMIFTILLTWYFFREKIRYLEYIAMLLILIASVIIIWG